jgi:hypothetical protein
MKNAVRQFPWFEVALIVGLAVALIVKPQNRTLSATPAGSESVRLDKSAVSDLIPLSAATQPRAGL